MVGLNSVDLNQPEKFDSLYFSSLTAPARARSYAGLKLGLDHDLS